MVDVHFTDLPNALIACKVDENVFTDRQCKAGFEALFRSFDCDATFQFFKSFRRVRINFSDAVTAAQARVTLHKSDFNGKEMRLYFAQSLHIGNPRLEPPKPDKQFLISPPASPPVGWEQAKDATPAINYDLLCAIARLGPGDSHFAVTVPAPNVHIHLSLSLCPLLHFDSLLVLCLPACSLYLWRCSHVYRCPQCFYSRLYPWLGLKTFQFKRHQRCNNPATHSPGEANRQQLAATAI
ncbi:calcipressin-1-like isoform X2 [Polyodon spathula]|uniref:calcipressin-1-like isoform X2 n=1 Tax=Polyodon spathula TaxID=7913 RepID=UPI001B7EB85E|nr:calcipressin-1-like isoform X2 [Polyodon spathula]